MCSGGIKTADGIGFNASGWLPCNYQMSVAAPWSFDERTEMAFFNHANDRVSLASVWTRTVKLWLLVSPILQGKPFLWRVGEHLEGRLSWHEQQPSWHKFAHSNRDPVSNMFIVTVLDSRNETRLRSGEGANNLCFNKNLLAPRQWSTTSTATRPCMPSSSVHDI